MSSSEMSFVYGKELGVLCAAIGAICGAAGEVLAKFASRLSIANSWYSGHHPLKLVGLTLSSCIEPLLVVVALTFVPAVVSASFLGFRCFSHLAASRLLLEEPLSNQHILASLLILFGIAGVLHFGTFDLVVVSTPSQSPLSPLFDSLASANWLLFVVLYLSCLALSLWLFTASIRKESSTLSSIRISIPVDRNTNQNPAILNGVKVDRSLFEIETSTGPKAASAIVPPVPYSTRSPSQDGPLIFTSGVVSSSNKLSTRKYPSSNPQSLSLLSSIRQFWCIPIISIPYFIGRCSRSPTLLLLGSAITPGLLGSLSYLIGDVTLKGIYNLGLISHFRLIVLSILAVGLGIAFGVTLKISSDLYDTAVVIPICHCALIVFTVLGSWALWTTQTVTANALTSLAFTMFMLSALLVIWGIALASRADLVAQISRLRFEAEDLEHSFEAEESQIRNCSSPKATSFGRSEYGTTSVMMSADDDDDVDQYVDELEETLRAMRSQTLPMIDREKLGSTKTVGLKPKRGRKLKGIELHEKGRYMKLVHEDDSSRCKDDDHNILSNDSSRIDVILNPDNKTTTGAIT